MDEKTIAQDLDDQEEVFDMSEEKAPEVNEAAFEEDEEDIFDMEANQAVEMFEQQQLDELNQFKEVEGFAAKFSEKWVLGLPEDTKKVNAIISTQLAKKTRRA